MPLKVTATFAALLFLFIAGEVDRSVVSFLLLGNGWGQLPLALQLFFAFSTGIPLTLLVLLAARAYRERQGERRREEEPLDEDLATEESDEARQAHQT